MYVDALKLEEELDEFLYDFGFQTVDLQTAGTASRRIFRLFVDRVNGAPVTINDCSTLAPQVQLFLEMRGVYADNCSLEVSSGGLDRVLKRSRDFERYLGHEVKVSYFTGSAKQTIAGKLSSFSDDVLVITTRDRQDQPHALNIERGSLERVNLVPSVEM
jgi:ribosome maturation factor RimP